MAVLVGAFAYLTMAKMVEVDEASLIAMRKAIADDDVGAIENSMSGATDVFAPGGEAHQRQTWDGNPRGVGDGIAHDETPYYAETYDGGAEYCGNLEDDNDDGRHLGRVYTVLHHAVHCNSQNVIEWAISKGADPCLASTWKEGIEDHDFLAALQNLKESKES